MKIGVDSGALVKKWLYERIKQQKDSRYYICINGRNLLKRL
jgi:hypothetical protein